MFHSPQEEFHHEPLSTRHTVVTVFVYIVV